MFGLAMGLATIFFIPSGVEPFVWPVIFIVCAYLIAKQASGRPFLHGLLLGIANSIWITAAHILFFDRYLGGHPSEARTTFALAAAYSPKIVMAGLGLLAGLVSGAVIGVLAVLVAKILKSSER